MLLVDYGTIIIRGLCNSPRFLENHFKREIKILNEKGYENDEIHYKFGEVLRLCKESITQRFDKENLRYKEYLDADKKLPKEERYFYQKPELNEISLLEIRFPSGRNTDLSTLTRKFTINDFEQVEAALERVINSKKGEKKTEQNAIVLKPIFKPGVAEIIFEIVKDFFSAEQQPELNRVLQTGNNASSKLLFKGNGNRLTDTFKKLVEHNFIVGCQKQDLINWIISNFNFTHRQMVKSFVFDTVEKTISRNHYPCKSPLIEIKSGQIQKVENLKAKGGNRY